MLRNTSFSHGRLLFISLSAIACFLVILLLTLTWGSRTAEGAADFGVTASDLQLDTLIPEQGGTVIVSVTVTNHGSDPGNLTLELKDGSTPLEQQNRTGVAPGESVTLTFTWDLPAETDLGDHTLRAQLSSEDDTHTANDAAQRRVVVYHPFSSDGGDLRVSSSKSYANYLHDGHIWVSANGALELERGPEGEQGTFLIEQDRDDQFYLMVEDNGVLHLKENTVLRSNRPMTLFLRENSRLIVDSGALLDLKRIVARDNSLIQVNGGHIKADLDLRMGNLLMAGTGLEGAGAWARLSGATATIDTSPSGSATSFLNARLEYETLHLSVAGPLQTNNSRFVVEDAMSVMSTSSEMTDTSFTKGLTQFTTGSHALVNVSTPQVKATGDTLVERYWYLGVRVLDLGENPVPGAEVAVRPTQTTQVETGTTDDQGRVTFTLLSNLTSSAGDDFTGNFEVRAKYEGHEPLAWRSLTLIGNSALTLSLGDVRLTDQYNVKLLLFAGDTQVLRERKVAGESPLKVRVILTFKDASRDPAPGVVVTALIEGEGQSQTRTTDENGVVEIPLRAPKESGTYRVEVRVSGSTNPSLDMQVEGESGELTGGRLAVLVVVILLVVVVLLILIQRTNLTYPTEIAQCGGCGQRIPLDSKTCPECGEKLDPYEAFDPQDSSWVSRQQEE